MREIDLYIIYSPNAAEFALEVKNQIAIRFPDRKIISDENLGFPEGQAYKRILACIDAARLVLSVGAHEDCLQDNHYCLELHYAYHIHNRRSKDVKSSGLNNNFLYVCSLDGSNPPDFGKGSGTFLPINIKHNRTGPLSRAEWEEITDLITTKFDWIRSINSLSTIINSPCLDIPTEPDILKEADFIASLIELVHDDKDLCRAIIATIAMGTFPKVRLQLNNRFPRGLISLRADREWIVEALTQSIFENDLRILKAIHSIRPGLSRFIKEIHKRFDDTNKGLQEDDFQDLQHAEAFRLHFYDKFRDENVADYSKESAAFFRNGLLGLIENLKWKWDFWSYFSQPTSTSTQAQENRCINDALQESKILLDASTFSSNQIDELKASDNINRFLHNLNSLRDKLQRDERSDYSIFSGLPIDRLPIDDIEGLLSPPFFKELGDLNYNAILVGITLFNLLATFKIYVNDGTIYGSIPEKKYVGFFHKGSHDTTVTNAVRAANNLIVEYTTIFGQLLAAKV